VSGLVIVASLAIAPQARAQASDSEALAKRGRSLFQNKGCSTCHAVGKVLAGPNLAGVTSRRSREWINKLLTDTKNMLATDSTAQALVKEFKGVKMPEQKLAEADIDALLAYIDAEAAKAKK
jgi:nitrite reductase (NO-forming)